MVLLWYSLPLESYNVVWYFYGIPYQRNIMVWCGIVMVFFTSEILWCGVVLLCYYLPATMSSYEELRTYCIVDTLAMIIFDSW